MAKKSRKGSVAKFFKFILIGGSIVFILGVIGSQLVIFLTSADLFKIRAVIIDPSLKNTNVTSNSLDRLAGRNIFKVNLSAVEQDLKRRYPGIDQLHLVRYFPDKILVVAANREPFAMINAGGKGIVVDRKGIVVTGTPANVKLPVITGVTLTRAALVGRPINQPQVLVALNIIRSIQTNEDLRDFPLVSIDVSNLSSINFLLSNQMKIIIDDDKIYPKIRKLGILLGHSNVNLNDYRYIDLRFNEPILGKTE
jgi:cell division septal protein FtsQ